MFNYFFSGPESTYWKKVLKCLPHHLQFIPASVLIKKYRLDASCDNDQLDLDEADERVIDKENVDPVPFHLQNPKVHRGKGRPVGTKRFKSAHEPSKLNSKQRRCKK